ncbi:MAG: HpcH/HpaI aldolase/citrate lyase family protein [Dongiaceae bacterium]
MNDGAATPLSAKQRLAAGEPLYGCFLNAESPILAELLARAGYDCLMIDREHSAADLQTARAMTQAIRTTACSPLVRVPLNDAAEIKRTLDIGIDGVMAPAVNSRAEAAAFVAACRYPPEGIRGVAVPIIRASGYGLETKRYIAEANDALLTIAQIETRAAVEAVSEIVAVPGIDMVFVGPYDLSASLGHLGEPDHPEARALIGQVEAAAKRAGKWLGTIATTARPADRLFADGYQLVLGSADVGLLREAALAQIERFRPKRPGRG